MFHVEHSGELAIIAGACAALRPPPPVKLSEWADAHAVLSAESAHHGARWRCIPYQRGIMDSITDPRVTEVTVKKSARVGFTKILNNAIGYHIHQDPCSILLVQPTIEDAEGYSKEEIAPMVRDTPVLRGLVKDAKSRDGNNTILHKLFPGGILSMVGANSPRGFRRVSRRVVLLDEIDGYPRSAGAEGDPIKLATKRAEWFWNRKIVRGSTPTDSEISRIDIDWKRSDQRRYFVPCPHCKHKQFLKWGGRDTSFGMKWPEGNPERAFYVCEKCASIIEHKWLHWMVERGEWVATAQGSQPGHAGFHIWAAYSYSPNATWGHLAREFLESKDDPELLKTFVNTTLGECWEDSYSARASSDEIRDRAEAYPLRFVPKDALLVTAGIDVQENRVAIKLKGWRNGEESWLVDWQEIHGDPTRPELWAQVDNVLDTPLTHASGADVPVRAAAIDTGHHTHAVYAWVRERARRHSRGEVTCMVIAIKGSSQPSRPIIGKPTRQDINWKGQLVKKGVEVYAVGTDTAKSVIYARLKRVDPGPGYMHFPTDESLTEDYYLQLSAERAMVRYVNGFAKKVWIKKAGQRNEALDCEVYALAALQFFYTRVNRATLWAQLGDKLRGTDQESPPDADPAPSGDTTRKSGFIARRRGRGGWMKG